MARKLAFLLFLLPIVYSLSSCGVINESGVYSIESNISTDTAPCITINASDVVLHGNGYWITHTTSKGEPLVQIEDAQNVTIDNLNLDHGYFYAVNSEAKLRKVKALHVNPTLNAVNSSLNITDSVFYYDNPLKGDEYSSFWINNTTAVFDVYNAEIYNSVAKKYIRLRNSSFIDGEGTLEFVRLENSTLLNSTINISTGSSPAIRLSNDSTVKNTAFEIEWTGKEPAPYFDTDCKVVIENSTVNGEPFIVVSSPANITGYAIVCNATGTIWGNATQIVYYGNNVTFENLTVKDFFVDNESFFQIRDSEIKEILHGEGHSIPAVLSNVNFTNAYIDALSGFTIENSNFHSNRSMYAFLSCDNITLSGIKMVGEYSFKSSARMENLTLLNSFINITGSFISGSAERWYIENTTIYNQPSSGGGRDGEGDGGGAPPVEPKPVKPKPVKVVEVGTSVGIKTLEMKGILEKGGEKEGGKPIGGGGGIVNRPSISEIHFVNSSIHGGLILNGVENMTFLNSEVYDLFKVTGTLRNFLAKDSKFDQVYLDESGGGNVSFINVSFSGKYSEEQPYPFFDNSCMANVENSTMAGYPFLMIKAGDVPKGSTANITDFAGSLYVCDVNVSVTNMTNMYWVYCTNAVCTFNHYSYNSNGDKVGMLLGHRTEVYIVDGDLYAKDVGNRIESYVLYGDGEAHIVNTTLKGRICLENDVIIENSELEGKIRVFGFVANESIIKDSSIYTDELFLYNTDVTNLYDSSCEEFLSWNSKMVNSSLEFEKSKKEANNIWIIQSMLQNVTLGSSSMPMYGEEVEINDSVFYDSALILDRSSNWTIYNNIFEGTTFEFVGEASNGTHAFNTTLDCSKENILGQPCVGGNYYGDYMGSDTNGDGIGDEPYTIGNYSDMLPLKLNKLPLIFSPAFTNFTTFNDTIRFTIYSKVGAGNLSWNGTVYRLQRNIDKLEITLPLSSTFTWSLNLTAQDLSNSTSGVIEHKKGTLSTSTGRAFGYVSYGWIYPKKLVPKAGAVEFEDEHVGDVKYVLGNGSAWFYWNGSEWVVGEEPVDAKTIAEHIDEFPYSKLVWKAWLYFTNKPAVLEWVKVIVRPS